MFVIETSRRRGRIANVSSVAELLWSRSCGASAAKSGCRQANVRAAPEPEAALRARFLLMLRAWYAAHTYEPAADAAFAADAARCLPRADIDVVVNCYYRHEHTMLYER